MRLFDLRTPDVIFRWVPEPTLPETRVADTSSRYQVPCRRSAASHFGVIGSLLSLELSVAQSTHLLARARKTAGQLWTKHQMSKGGDRIPRHPEKIGLRRRGLLPPRERRIKIGLVISAGLLFGALLFIAEAINRAWNHLTLRAFFVHLPLVEVGATLISVAVIAIVLEVFLRDESARYMIAMLLANEQVLRETLSTDQLDKLATAAFKARLERDNASDDVLAKPIYDYTLNLAEQRGPPGKWLENYVKHARISLIPDSPAVNPEVRKQYFDCHLNIRYRTTLDFQKLRFSAFGDQESYRSSLRTESSEIVFRWWYQLRLPEGENLTKEWFDIESVAIDAFPLTKSNDDETKRAVTASNDGETNRVRRDYDFSYRDKDPNLEPLWGQMVSVNYVCAVKVRKDAPGLWLDIASPSRGVALGLTYDSNTGIRDLRPTYFFASKQLPSVIEEPLEQPLSVVVDTGEWVFPISGVYFAWTRGPRRRADNRNNRRVMPDVPAAGEDPTLTDSDGATGKAASDPRITSKSKPPE